MSRLVVPRNLAAAAACGGRQGWLETTLPAAIEEARQHWSLAIGEPFQPGGQTAWVAPVRGVSGASLVLKVAWWHPESAHETDGLRAWAGRGAIRLHAARDHGDAIVLLAERCVPGGPLSDRPEAEQDTVIAGLLRRLWIPPPRDHPFRSLAVMCPQWAEQYERKVTGSAVRL
jgi:streptomycin 6-kinase